MLDSWGAFDTTIKLSNQALTAVKTARFKKLSDQLDENFFKFDRDWRTYKADTILKTCKTEEAFNEQKEDEGTEVSAPAFHHNDSWADNQMTRYSDILDKLQEGLEALQVQPVEEKPAQANVDLLVMVVKSELATLEGDIKRLEGDIQLLDDYSILLFTKSMYDAQIQNFFSRLTVGLLEKSNDILATSDEK